MSTDADRRWFQDADFEASGWKLSFLADYESLLAQQRARDTVDEWTKWQGPLEQIMCVYARLFVGSASSTFTRHIQEMRGYVVD
tara:strand:- start:362 stop:613 length:252 start_codon:yes stop_codon:yes gene_type:complete